MQVRSLLYCAFFAALTAVCSQIAIPLYPVPVNLAWLPIFLASLLLGSKLGALSQIVYVCLGLVGLPVFSMFRGGLGVLAGSTGGYIVGYILMAAVIGWLYSRGVHSIIAILVGAALCYGVGTVWFMYLTKYTVFVALRLCVLPFLLGDGLKILAAYWLHRRLMDRIPPILSNKNKL